MEQGEYPYANYGVGNMDFSDFIGGLWIMDTLMICQLTELTMIKDILQTIADGLETKLKLEIVEIQEIISLMEIK